MAHDQLSKKNPFTWDDKVIMITGGTGSFGKKCTEILLKEFKPKKVIIFSRDELKQQEMCQSGFNDPSLRYFIGDIRDRERLARAMNGVDIVIHAAALKQVPSCEYNPMEAIMTNVIGTRNIVDAALDMGVSRLLALSTDKAVNPVNLYGATKLCSEKLVIQSNAYSGLTGTRFACVRYGNVVGSRGSVVPVFQQQKKSGQVTVTDDRMTRFWLTLEQGVHFVLNCIEQMQGGEVFVPKIPSMRILDLVEAVAPNCKVNRIGIRPGEKLHEILLSEDEARNAIEYEKMYVVLPTHPWWCNRNWKGGTLVKEDFRYVSDSNTEWLKIDDLKELVSETDAFSPNLKVVA